MTPGICPIPAVLVIGVSDGPVCGVRDHGNLLSEALQQRDFAVETSWWERPSRSRLRDASHEARQWSDELKQSVHDLDPKAVLVHYSVFSYSHRGIPLFVIPVFRSLRGDNATVPILTLLHEFAYPWRTRGLRGIVWAITQRLTLWFVVARSSALIVTTQDRADWISTRRWLPRRRVCVAPVFSSLPRGRQPSRVSTPAGAQIGLFGYGYEDVVLQILMGALSELRETRADARLLLLGAPGADSPLGQQVCALARQRGLEDALNFTGVLPARALADALAGCDVLLFVDSKGPTSRRTTLAASLASGRPVVALNGPNTWDDLVRDRAIALVEPTSQALALAVGHLLIDISAANALGSRGRAFADRNMSVDQTVNVVLASLRQVEPRA